MHSFCGRDRILLSLVALFLACSMVGEASAASRATVTSADGSEATDGGGALGECKQAPELNGDEAVAEDSQGEGSDGDEEASAEAEDLGRDCSNEEPIDPNADYN